MNTKYNTVITRERIKNDDVQKDSLCGQLYDRVSFYYRDLINKGNAFIDYGYIKGEDLKGFPIDIDESKIKDDTVYIYVGIYDYVTGEQIL